MEDLVKKISDYQIFNFLLPGSLFAYLLSTTTSFNLIIENVIIAFFVYYFIGLMISRVGSIVVEPILKWLKIIKFAPYPDFLKALKNDPKLNILSQENNTYRSLISVGIIYLTIYLIDNTQPSIINNFSEQSFVLTISLAIIVLLILSHRKQTGFIVKRIMNKSK